MEKDKEAYKVPEKDMKWNSKWKPDYGSNKNLK